jgi:hypothetical protein
VHCCMKVGSFIIRFKKNIMHFWDIFFFSLPCVLVYLLHRFSVSIIMNFFLLGCEPFVHSIKYIFPFGL